MNTTPARPARSPKGKTMANTTQPELEKHDALVNGLEVLTFGRHVTMGLLEDIDDKAAFHRPIVDGNHAMWIAGHIAWDDDFFLTGLAARTSQLPDPWKSLFRSGSTVFDQADKYPAFVDVIERMGSLRADLLDWFGAMSPDELIGPMPMEFRRFGETYGALMGTLAWHEGLHAGQLTVIRKSLGLKPRFG